jgi:hypothetical protein
MIDSHGVKSQGAVKDKNMDESCEKPFVFKGTLLEEDFSQCILDSF